MKLLRSLLLTAILGLGAVVVTAPLATPADAAIALRFAAKGNATGSATCTTSDTPTLGANNNSVTGDTLVLMISDPQATKTPSDTIGGAASGNTWTRSGTQLVVGTTRMDVWYVQNATGGTDHNFIVTGGGSMDAGCFAYVISGAATASFDKQAQGLDATAPFGDALSTGTLTQANELAIEFYANNGGSNTLGGGTTWTDGPEEENGALYWVSTSAYKIVAATTAIAGAATNSGGVGGDTHGVHILTFMEAGGGGGGTNLLMKRRRH